jgi:hypothetical protein
MTVTGQGPTRAEIEAAGQLPRPGRERWQPLRVGLLDLFHYDYQEFWFRDGRLLWRGNNGTGKSKVLALTLPFLLDGEASAHRVEPDGDPHKKMEWNLLLAGRYPERLGYTWIEFGRLDPDGTEHYLTAGIALKAVTGRGIADRWFFVTDRRVGAGLPLVTSTGTAMTRDRLTEAIGDRGQVVRTAEHYRRLLDDRLFQLGADRYGALLDLLIQLRQPQLSKRPDAAVLSRALSQALTPLDQGLLADAAAGFHDLEQQRLELQSLKETHDHVRRFHGRYSRYAAIAARRQARDLRSAHSLYEEVGRRLAEVRQQATQAQAARDDAAARLEAIRQGQSELQAVRDQLTERPEMHDLDRATREAETARGRAASAGQRLQSARTGRDRATGHAASAVAAAEEAAHRREELMSEVAATADDAACATAHAHALQVPGVLAEPAVLRRCLLSAADDRAAALAQVRLLAQEAAESATRLTGQQARLGQLEADRDAAGDAVARARAGVVEAGERLVREWTAFAARAEAIDVPYPDEVGLPGWVTALTGPDPASSELDERVQRLRRDLARREATAQAQLAQVGERIGELVARQGELEAGIPPVPPVPPTRDVVSRSTRPGAPLWRAVDVGCELSDGQRAGLEAALQAAGLLDAWITPDGAVLDADQFDAVLLQADAAGTGTTGTGTNGTGTNGTGTNGTGTNGTGTNGTGTTGRERSRTLADLLYPAIDRDDNQAAALDDGVVVGVLRAIRVDPDLATLTATTATTTTAVTTTTTTTTTTTADPGPGTGCVVSLDGGYRLGNLHGRWLKPHAEYLGAGAREQARRRHLAELAVALDAAEREREHVESALAEVRRLDAAVAQELRERPSDQRLRDAHARAGAASAELDRREAALPPAQEAAETARTAAALAHGRLTETAADLGLPTATADQDRVAAALTRYRAQGAELVAAVQRRLDRAAEVRTWQAELEAADDALEDAAQEHQRAADDDRAAQARLRTLTDSLGSTVTQLRAQLERTAAELARLEGEHRVRDGEHTQAVLRLGQALGRQDELLTEQGERQQQRDRSVVALRAFAATGLLTVAVPEIEMPDPGAEWAADPAVRLARRVEAALSEIDDSDQAWKRIQEEITRRFAELTESLTRHGHQAHADLREGRYVVTILYTGRERGPAELITLLATETELRERELTTREQQVLEEHLVGDVASRLQELITEADAMVGWMNAELAERPTSTGMRLRLAWQPDPDGPEGLAQARSHLLRQTSQLWSPEDRRAVRDFLQRQIQQMRSEDPHGTWTDHLRRALDYRAWHRFVIERWQDGSWRSAIGPASGGERVLTVSLPLFAAASAHYRSAHPHAPRLVLLDEAFAGVDDDARAKCLGLLTQFDLDVAMTSEREWGFYATVPGIATYQLVRHDGVDAVHVTAWEWDGNRPNQVPRPTTLPRAAAPAPKAGPSGGTDPEQALF